ncbi:MAG: hypothetical protein AB1609_02490 [Bacillota bacterium]
MCVNVDFERPSASLVRAFAELGAATVYEANGQMGRMNSAIKPLAPGMKVAGPALPVRCHPGDNLMVHVAVSVAKPGDVLVVDAGGYPFGERCSPSLPGHETLLVSSWTGRSATLPRSGIWAFLPLCER